MPEPGWPEPPEGWTFWSPVLEGGGSLNLTDRAALEAELSAEAPGSYGCSTVTWWTASEAVAPAVAETGVALAAPPDAETAPPEVVPAETAMPEVAPVTKKVSRGGARTSRRGVRVATVILCALGLVGFQAGRIVLASQDGEEIPKPVPISDTRTPARGPATATVAPAEGGHS